MDPGEAFETLAAAQLALAGVTRRSMFGRDTTTTWRRCWRGRAST